MILTGKAKEDFLRWNEDNDAPLSTYAIEQGLIYGTVLNSIIIEWLDSVGIYIEIIRNEGYFDYVVGEEWDYGFDTRQEATQQAIIKANEIYNERG